MDYSLRVIKQTVIMSLIICVGILCYKRKLLNDEAGKKLSGFVLNVVAPCFMFMSYQIEFSPDRIKGLLTAFALSLAVHIVFQHYSVDSRFADDERKLFKKQYFITFQITCDNIRIFGSCVLSDRIQNARDTLKADRLHSFHEHTACHDNCRNDNCKNKLSRYCFG